MATTNDVQIPLKEKLKSIPEFFGIRVNEEPNYKVLESEDDFEVRVYPRLLVARVHSESKSFDEFRKAAFKKLAHYIFQGNADGKEIPMTAPVLEEHGFVTEEHNSGWTMSFILPHEINFENAPEPKDPAVKLEELEPQLIACVSYSGNNSLENIKIHERKLADWLKKNRKYHMAGKFAVAQYDAPFTLAFMKKNEIQVKIEILN